MGGRNPVWAVSDRHRPCACVLWGAEWGAPKNKKEGVQGIPNPSVPPQDRELRPEEIEGKGFGKEIEFPEGWVWGVLTGEEASGGGALSPPGPHPKLGASQKELGARRRLQETHARRLGTRLSREGLTKPPAVSCLVSFAGWVVGHICICSFSKHFLGAHCVPGPVLSTGKHGQMDRSGRCPLERDINKSTTSTSGAKCFQ